MLKSILVTMANGKPQTASSHLPFAVNAMLKVPISKTNNGGLCHLRIKRKVVRAYKNVINVERCPVELYKKYLSHVSEEISDNAFHLLALTKPKGDVWFFYKAMGRETLGNVVKNIMRKAGFEGRFTNHSLRRTCATWLYEGGVPEQVIGTVTLWNSLDASLKLSRNAHIFKRSLRHSLLKEFLNSY